MTDIAGFSTITIRYGKDGRPIDAQHADKLRSFAKDSGLSDLLVLSHGWNNTESEAMAHYEELGAALARQIGNVPPLAGSKIGLALVIWPSKAIEGWEEDGTGGQGGAAAAGTAQNETEIDPNDVVEQAIEDLGLAGDEADALRNAARAAIEDGEEFDAFFDTAAAAFAKAPPAPSAPDPEDGVDPVAEVDVPDENADEKVFDPERVKGRNAALRKLGREVGVKDGFSSGGAGAGGRGAGGAVVGALNILSFYRMKNRAGHVGSRGVAHTLAGLRVFAPGLRIHLSGHSFGARVLTMATLALNGSKQARPDTLCLVQAAFSHNSFSDRVPKPNGGFFRPVVGEDFVNGKMIVTHTRNDKAVFIAYSIASAAVGEQAANANASRFGGLGANGTQHTDEATNIKMQAPGAAYDFSTHDVYNLEASDFVSNHADVRNDGVAFTICSAMGA